MHFSELPKVIYGFLRNARVAYKRSAEVVENKGRPVEQREYLKMKCKNYRRICIRAIGYKIVFNIFFADSLVYKRNNQRVPI